MSLTLYGDTTKRLALRVASRAPERKKHVRQVSLARRRLRDGSVIEYPINRRRVDLSGQRFGKWLAIKHTGANKNGAQMILCKCDCGTEREVQYGNLTKGLSISCGCIKDDFPAITHGQSGSKEYISWLNMKARCLKPSNKAYHHYGGRGIRICLRWVNSFENFFDDMGPCPVGLTIERKNNNKGYCPSNCKWDTREVQRNNTRTNVFVRYLGRSQTISQWAREIKMSPLALRARITNYGWSIALAMTTPVSSSNRKSKLEPAAF